MRRRNFFLGMTSLGISGLMSDGSRAYTQCNTDMFGNEICESGISLGNVTYALQNKSQWCWAASVEMTFSYYGFTVEQERIVTETYGVDANIPAVTGYVISKNLQRDWVDDQSKSFSVEIEGLYDFDAGIKGITDDQIISALDDERPLIMGTSSHAVLLISVAYAQTLSGPRIGNIGVADPFPYVGFRGPYSVADFVPMDRGGNLRYLCLPRVY